MNISTISRKLMEFYKEHKKWVLVGAGGLAVIILSAVIFLPNEGNGSQKEQILYMEVTSGSITESIDVVGSLEAVPSIILSWKSGGIISPFDLSIGDQVEKDQV